LSLSFLRPADSLVVAALQAISGDDDHALLRLLDTGLDPNAVDPSGAPLLFFCVEGHLRCLSLMLARGANPNLATPDGTTPFMRAVRTCKLCLSTLTRSTLHWNQIDRAGNNALHHGAMAHSPQALAALELAIRHSPESLLEQANHKGMSPLAISCYYDNPAALQIFINHGANPLAINSQTGHDPLAYCLEHGKVACTLHLWRFGSLDRAAPDGGTLLRWASTACENFPALYAAIAPLIAQAEHVALSTECHQGADALGSDSKSL